MTRVKICGCRTPEQALVAKDAGADFIGLMFAPESRRRVSREQATEIVAALHGGVQNSEASGPLSLSSADYDLASWFGAGAALLEEKLAICRPLTVGVFANNDIEEIKEVVAECGIDLVQLSGGEDWAMGQSLPLPVVKVLHVGAEDSVTSLKSRLGRQGALAVMLDKASQSAKGGTGQSFDWEAARGLAQAIPIWLAGGLTPENVAGAVQRVGPWCVDVSSGVETDGIKDAQKIRAFVNAAKAAPLMGKAEVDG